jgi:predicted SAM-dependent methyltransferase
MDLKKVLGFIGIKENSINVLGPTELENIIIDYGCSEGGGLNYAKNHHMRYCETLKIIKNENKKPRILELGGSYPFAFTLMLNAAFPDSEIVLGQYSDIDASCVSLISTSTGKTIQFESQSFNIESDHWPFSDNSFDIVFCMEILEHLLLDPCFVFREAHRVLKANGQLIVTTPNIACCDAIFNLINFKTPYIGGHYSQYGPYGRHNREYVPAEVEKIGQSCSFSTALLTTVDVHEGANYAETLMKQFPYNAELRKHNIIYMGIKENRAFSQYPRELFDYEPDLHLAKIEVKEISSDAAHGEPVFGIIELSNLGHYTWEASGREATRLGVQLLDKHWKLIERDFRRIDLIKPLHPGESTEMKVSISGIRDPGEYILRFDMVHENVCWFSYGNPNYVDKRIKVN